MNGQRQSAAETEETIRRHREHTGKTLGRHRESTAFLQECWLICLMRTAWTYARPIMFDQPSDIPGGCDVDA